MAHKTLAGLRAVIHARESRFQARAGNRSTTEQVTESRAWCEAEGIDVAHVIVEENTTGAAEGRSGRAGRRERWERTKHLLAAGDDNGPLHLLVTWSSTRGQRDLEEYVALRKLCVDAGVLWCYGGRVYDLSDGDDRFRTGVDALVGERDIEETRKAINRGLRANVANGKPHGPTLYGYRRIYDPETRAFIRQEPNQDQAWVVRDIFSLYLAGHSTNEIADGLVVANVLGLVFGPGLPTSTGVGSWAAATVRRILANPAFKGRRTHNGSDVGVGMWPALVDADTFDRAAKRLEQRSVKRNRTGPQPHLLTGVAVCGACHGRMTHMPAWRNREAFYYCRAKGRHVSRGARLLDAWVTAAVLERLARPDVADVLAGDEPPAVTVARATLAGLRAELDEALARFRGELAPGLSVQGYAAVEAHLLPRISTAEAAMRSARVPLDITVPPAEQVPGWWDGLSAHQRRELVAALIVEVTVDPVGRGARGYDWSEVTRIEWRR